MKKPELRMDPAKLREMKEPFLVRVEKMRGNSRTPIELPVRGDGLAPGEGWDRESILKIDNWLATEWSGGGIYRILIVDTDGEKMEWESVFDPRTFPEKVPQSMAIVPPPPPLIQGAPQAPQANQHQQHSNVPYGSWPPSAWSPPPPVVQGPNGPQGHNNNNVPPPTQTAYGPWATAWNGNGVNGQYGAPYRPNFFSTRRSHNRYPEESMSTPWNREPPRDTERERIMEAEKKQLAEQLQKLERDRIEAEYKAQLERQQQEHRTQMASLQQEIRLAAEKTAAVPPPPGPNPELEALKEARLQFERDRERAAQEERAKALEALISANNNNVREQMAQMMANTQQMIQALTAASTAKPTGPDPMILEMREQLRAQQDQMARERERADAERRFTELQAAAKAQEAAARDEARRAEEKWQRQLELMQREQAERVREQAERERAREIEQRQRELVMAQNKGPDPALTILQQSISHQVEAMRELARQQQTSFDRLSNTMMSPRDIISLMKDGNSGFDELRKNIIGVYGDIFNTQKMLVEQAMQLSGGGGPSLGERVIENGVEKVAALADRYLGVQRDRAVSDAKARQAQAEATAKMASVQQAQQEEIARQRAAAHAAAVAQQTRARAAQQAAQTGAQTPQAPQAAQTTPQAQVDPAATATAGSGLGDAAPVETTEPKTDARPMGKVIAMRTHGHTDEEWFGPAHVEVKKLRNGVKQFLDAIGRVDEDGNPDPHLNEDGSVVGYSPEQCARFLIIGANRVSGMGINVKAFNDLFAQERFADFMDVVLPDAPQLFRDDVVQALLSALDGSDETDDPSVDDANGEGEE